MCVCVCVCDCVCVTRVCGSVCVRTRARVQVCALSFDHPAISPSIPCTPLRISTGRRVLRMLEAPPRVPHLSPTGLSLLHYLLPLITFLLPRIASYSFIIHQLVPRRTTLVGSAHAGNAQNHTHARSTHPRTLPSPQTQPFAISLSAAGKALKHNLHNNVPKLFTHIFATFLLQASVCCARWPTKRRPVPPTWAPPGSHSWPGPSHTLTTARPPSCTACWQMS